jgi:branched-subunit amino acid transport protein
VGEAALGVSVSRPSLLRLIPANVLEATGRSLLAGILLGMKTRVGQQLVNDFESWCQNQPAALSPATHG